jgi:glycosyltransferase involved in cell wall biosynthesis
VRSPSIWLDVSTILWWRRPPVGIVRVEAECFKVFRSSGANVRFCHLDKSTGSYFEIDSASAATALELAQRPPAPAVRPAPPSAREKIDVVRMIRSAVERAPKPLQPALMAIGRLGKRGLRKVRDGMRNATRRLAELGRRLLRSPPAPPQPVPATAPFGPGDVYVSLGLDWPRKDLSELYRFKQKLDLKILLCCYDLIPVKLPHVCVGEVAPMFGHYFVDVAWCADEILCISRNSQRDLLSFLQEVGAPIPQTTVFRLGSEVPSSTGEISENVAEILKRPFLLFVSTIERRKNHEVLYRAYTRLVDQGRRDLPLLVFVGMRGWGVHDFMEDLRLDLRVQSQIRILDHVTDKELQQLYRSCLFTLYPSTYEGWGLPLAESLACGKFALASNSSSIPEVGESFVEYLDPWDTPAWCARIAHYLDNPAELAAREARIRAEYRRATWQQTGEFVLGQALHLQQPAQERGQRAGTA